MAPRTRAYRANANVAPNGTGLVYGQVAELEETDEVKAMVGSELLEVVPAREAKEILGDDPPAEGA